MQNTLPETGERMLPEMENVFTVIEHLHRYAMAQHFCTGKDVLDIACGEGYGSNMLSKSARHVTGVDIDTNAVEYAKKKYSSPNLLFKQGQANSIPIDDKSVDVVVSFETIEHHDKHDEMMLEIIRVLKPGGVLIISTPDKKIYSELTGYKNPYHIKELYKDEFYKLLKKYFLHVEMFGQSSGTLSVLCPLTKTNIENYWSVKGKSENLAVSDSLNLEYIIAVASQAEIVYKPISIFYGEKTEQDIYSQKLKAVLNSTSYKLGNALIRPFRWFARKGAGRNN